MKESRVALLAGCVLLLAAAWWHTGRGEGPPLKAFVVQALNWRFTARGDPFLLDDGEPGHPVRAFAERAEAEAFRRRMDLRAREGKNPFWHVAIGADGQFTTDGDAFAALMKREGFVPPKRDKPAWDYTSLYDDPWVAWWDRESPKWDARLRTSVWDALDRVRFYKVVEVGRE